MKRRIITIVIVCLALLGVVAFAFVTGSKSQKSQSVTSSAQTPTTPTVDSSGESKNPGAYVAYSPDAVASASGTKILFFHAAWCPQCRQLDSSIKDGTVPDGVTIYKVDYDANQALRKQYGVTIQTTLVSIDANGALVKKYVAYDNPSLSAVISNLLP